MPRVKDQPGGRRRAGRAAAVCAYAL